MFRECGLAHHAPAGLRADHLLRPAGARGRGKPAQPVRHRQPGRRHLGGGQAVLRAAAGRAPAARTGRVLLQHGQHPAAAPAVFPQRLHFRAPGRVHRAPGRHAPLLPGLLPRHVPLEAGAAAGDHRPGPGLRLPGHRVGPAAGGGCRPRPVRPGHVPGHGLPGTRAAFTLFPQQGCLPDRPDHQ